MGSLKKQLQEASQQASLEAQAVASGSDEMQASSDILERRAVVAEALAHERQEELNRMRVDLEALGCKNAEESERNSLLEEKVVRLKSHLDSLLTAAEGNASGQDPEVAPVQESSSDQAEGQESVIKHPLAKPAQSEPAQEQLDEVTKVASSKEGELDQLRNSMTQMESSLATQTTALEQERKRSMHLQQQLDSLNASQTQAAAVRILKGGDIENGECGASEISLTELGCGGINSLQTLDRNLQNVSQYMVKRADLRLGLFCIWLLQFLYIMFRFVLSRSH